MSDRLSHPVPNGCSHDEVQDVEEDGAEQQPECHSGQRAHAWTLVAGRLRCSSSGRPMTNGTSSWHRRPHICARSVSGPGVSPYRERMPSTVLVDDMTPAFTRYASEAADAPFSRRQELWNRLVSGPHTELLDYVQQRRDDSGDGGAAHGDTLAKHAREMPARLSGVLVAVEEVATSLSASGWLEGPPLPVVLLAGTTKANGWVDDYRGKPTLFLEMTLLPPEPYARVLLSHEAVHVAQGRMGALSWPECLGSEVLLEGLATAVSEDICPGLSPSAYLWMDDEHGAWVAECEQHRDGALAYLIANVSSADERVRRSLLAAGAHEQPWPARLGYALGLELARTLERQVSAQDVTASTWSSAREELLAAARRMLHDARS